MNTALVRKRRATRACCHCRGRKVRCDVMEYGSPCTNCRLDKVDCLTLERRKKRTADEIKRCKRSCSSEERQNPKLRVLAASDYNETTQLDEPYPILEREDDTGFILPQYTKPLPIHLDQDDIRFLARKGALTVPATCLRNKLLTSYAHHVHSDMPLLDLDELVRPIVQSDKHHPISLLLLQAVLFSATAFLDIEDLQAAGFNSRMHARVTFFQRARLLYEFDYEKDRITLVQALLLMSYWEEEPNGIKDGWYWLGLSLSIAQTVGLHRKTESTDSTAARIRTRLWWCIYARDCLMALDMRHPMHIGNTEFDAQPLTIDHFELEFSEPTVSSIGYSGLLGNAEHQRSLAVIFIEKVRLCHRVKYVLQSQYSLEVDPNARVVPVRIPHKDNQLSQYARDLHRWTINLAPEARYTYMGFLSLTKAEGILHIQRSSLRMAYLSLIGALYRPHIRTNQPADTENRVVPLEQLYSAADQIVNIAHDLRALHLTKFLPATAVTALYSAGVTQLLGVQSIASQGLNLQRLNTCLDSLMRLREMYPTGGSAAMFLEQVVGKIAPFYPEMPVSIAEWDDCMSISEHRKLSTEPQQLSYPSYAQSASEMTENPESPLFDHSPESVPCTDFEAGHDSFVVIDVESEFTLGQMMNLASSELVYRNKIYQ